ncbi:MAG: response regulator, partial [Bryobacteraceae bacterium]
FAVDVLGEAARRKGFPVEWVPSPPEPEKLLPAGKVDLWASLSISPERKRLFYFSQPYLQNEYCLVTRTRMRAEEAPSPMELTGQIVAFSSSRARSLLLAKILPNVRPLPMPDRESVLKALCDGRADSGFLEVRVATSHALRRPEGCRSVDLALAQLSGATLPIAIGAAPKAERYADALREEIGRMAADGSLTRIYGRWLIGSGGSIDEFLGLIEGAQREARLIGGVALLIALLGLLLWQVRRVRSARQAADAANAFKSQFLANMSHEMRTPMNGIMGLTALVLETELTSEQREYAEGVRSSSEALLGIINDVLDLSKIEAGKMVVEEAPFDLRAVISGVLKLMQPEADRKGLLLRLDYCAEAPRFLMGDAGRIRQIALNYVVNALKFTEAGEVVVRVSRQGRRLGAALMLIEVEDTGIGIAPHALRKLFQNFSQADSSTTRKHGGTGLGLAISKRLAELMDGSVGVRSEPGRGSTFWALLPLVPSERPQESGVAASLAALDVALQSKARVLLAEDNLINQRLFTRMLQNYGCDVDTASNGREALEMSSKNAYDAIFMDCQMPELDGYEAVAAIRVREAGKSRIPIIAITAHAMEQDRQRCLDAGMDDYLSKPISTPEVERVISKWLATAPSRVSISG